MRLAGNLLELAQYLVGHEPRRPKQATLRRTISTVYYAVFPLLVADATQSLIRGAANPGLRELTERAFEHGVMKQCCRAFAAGGLPPHLASLLPLAIPPDLRSVASAFVELQEARHSADYDTTQEYTRSQVLQLVQLAEMAFTAWQRVRATPEAQVFLVSLLLARSCTSSLIGHRHRCSWCPCYSGDNRALAHESGTAPDLFLTRTRIL